jgi:hypothetical protein
MAPSTTKQWVIQGSAKGFDELKLTEGPVPQVGEHDVLVKMHAASLNFRDLIIPKVCSPCWVSPDNTSHHTGERTLMTSRATTHSQSTFPSSPDPMEQAKWST